MDLKTIKKVLKSASIDFVCCKKGEYEILPNSEDVLVIDVKKLYNIVISENKMKLVFYFGRTIEQITVRDIEVSIKGDTEKEFLAKVIKMIKFIDANYELMSSSIVVASKKIIQEYKDNNDNVNRYGALDYKEEYDAFNNFDNFLGDKDLFNKTKKKAKKLKN